MPANSQLLSWLEQHGLAKHAELFARYEIDLDILAELDEQDLEKLGISLGDRKRILKALRGAGSSAEASPEGSASVVASAATESPAGAERRQLTVMFCDLVGSVALSQQLDPEELRSLIHAYRAACAAVIARYDGHIARYVGDGILTYFGWPKAHEDDAERSIRAALEIVQAVKAVPAPQSLLVHIGIATGLVVVGEQAGESPEAKLAVGPTPNLAARLQGLAGPNQIVIAASTRQLVGGAFELSDLGNHSLKGVSEPVRVWRVLQLAVTEDRFEATHGGSVLTPFVGREEELALLLARWKQSRDGEGQVVLLCGEPGIGKSRLTQTLKERLAAEAHTRLNYQCSPYLANSAFHPIISQLERAAGFERDDSAETKLDKLEMLLALEPDQLPVTAPLIAALLSLPIERYPPRMLLPQKQKELTMLALIEQVIRLAQRQPVLMLMEDVHWIDPSTTELLNLLPDRIRGNAVLLLVTHRPEFASPWSAQANVATLNLYRLSRQWGSTMVQQVTGRKPLPTEVLDQILAKTDGVPLFVEELTRWVLDSGFLNETPDQYEIKGPLPALAIPSSLQDSLMARLDRLAAAKEIAQIGACIGREFSHELLAAVSPKAEQALQYGLEQLMASGLIFRRGTSREATYSFKHALLQDTAYASLLRSRRREIHAMIGRTLMERFPERCEAQPELVARHLTEAGHTEDAIRFWRQAGERAMARSAQAEAALHLSHALELVRTLPMGPERVQGELGLLITLGPILMATKGFADPQVSLTYRQAREICQTIGDTPQIVPVLFGLWAFHVVRGNLGIARDLAEQIQRLLQGSDDTGILLEARLASGVTLYFLGELASARAELEAALTLYNPAKHRVHAQLFGQEPGMASHLYLASVLAVAGESAAAREHLRTAGQISNETAHLHSSARCLGDTMLVHYLLGDLAAVAETGRALLTLAVEQGFPIWKAQAEVLTGALELARDGDPAAAFKRMRRGIAEWAVTGTTLYAPQWKALLAQALSRDGRHEDAITLADEALAEEQAGEERISLAELHRVRAEVLAHKGGETELADARVEVQRAVEVARAHGAGLWELRALLLQLRLTGDEAGRAAARTALASAERRLAAAGDCIDLQHARSLLSSTTATA